MRGNATTKNPGNAKLGSFKEGPTTKLSGLSIRGRGRAPLAEISINQRQNTNSHVQGGQIYSSKPAVSK